ncbi:hypothetical protein [Runella sp.]|uniref:hypothetical protein n=1 Tax=Runella sp. TaxID=1960881 RepID=UPI0030184646
MAVQSISQQSSGQNTESKFGKITLGISFFIFLSTFSYWFISADSQASLINVFLKRSIDKNASFLTSYNGAYYWFVFYTHLIVTGLGLLIFHNSSFSKWLGFTISTQYSVANFFYEDKRLSKQLTIAKKVIFGVLLVITSYEVVRDVIQGDIVPRFSCGSFFVFFILSSIIWYIKPEEPLSFPNYTGIREFSHTQTWLKVAESQIAYVQNNQKPNQWEYYDSWSIINLSYVNVFLLESNNDLFNHTIDNELLYKDSEGELSYRCKIIFDFSGNLPAQLNTEQVKFLNVNLRVYRAVKSEISWCIDKAKVANEIKTKFQREAGAYFAPKNTFLEHDKEDIYESIKKITYNDTQIEMKDKIFDRISEKSGMAGLIKVEFTIVDQKFIKNEILEQIEAARIEKIDEIKIQQQKIFEAMIKDYTESRQKLLGALMAAMQNPAIDRSIIGEIRQLLLDLEKQKPDIIKSKEEIDRANLLLQTAQNKLNKLQLPIEKDLLAGKRVDEIKLVSEDITWAIKISVNKGLNKKGIMEEISKSTNYFKEKNISAFDFFERLEQNIADFKEEKEYEFYRDSVENTLKSLV